MASDASSTDGAVYASLGHVALIIVLAACCAIVITIGMGKLHRLANPAARSERDGILLLRLKMFAAWPLAYLAIAWTELTAHRLAGPARYRYEPRHGR